MSTDEPLSDSIRQVGVIRPGDALVLSTEADLDPQQATMIKRRVEDALPGVHVIVLTGMTVTVKRGTADDS
jgi:hypothetical protein